VVVTDRLIDALSPVLDRCGLDLVDLVVGGSQIQVTVDRPGGVDLDALAAANQAISRALDQLDPVQGSYILEVSSPGLERRLRTPTHFRRAVGETVTVRTLPDTAPLRRVSGRLLEADETSFEVETAEIPSGSLRLTYDQVERARTVFEWGPAPRPTRQRNARAHKEQSKR
jgi:ribosome maturation factor RimP